MEDLDRPAAKPGTIADREHRKWTEKAVALQHNPYSRESLEKRLSVASINGGGGGGGASDRRESAKALPEILVASPAPAPAPASRVVDCGLPSVAAARYARDYYINVGGSAHQGEEGQQQEVLDRGFGGQASNVGGLAGNGGKSERPPTGLGRLPKATSKAIHEADVVPSPTATPGRGGDAGAATDGPDPQNTSGFSSSSEMSTISKVGQEIRRFQRKISNETSAVRDKENSSKYEHDAQSDEIHKRRSLLESKPFVRCVSTDSLLSATADSDYSSAAHHATSSSARSSSSPPPAPAPPRVAPPKKRVSISPEEAEVICTPALQRRALEREEREARRANSPPPAVAVSRAHTDASDCDSFATLPSVKELASRFATMPAASASAAAGTQSGRSPAPAPRKSLSKAKKSSRAFKLANPDAGDDEGRKVFCHSLTARSVPRQFREGLKQGMPQRADRNIKLWHQHPGTPPPQQLTDCDAAPIAASARVTPSSSAAVAAAAPDTSMLHIVYDSERSDVVPYPDAEYVRTPSPEHTGIPAKPVKMVAGNGKQRRADVYSSDESGMATADNERSRKPLPAALRRKPKNAAAAISCG